jgi:hypothetical protein
VAETALAVAPAACGGDVLMCSRGGRRRFGLHRLVDKVLPRLACSPPSNFLKDGNGEFHTNACGGIFPIPVFVGINPVRISSLQIIPGERPCVATETHNIMILL